MEGRNFKRHRRAQSAAAAALARALAEWKAWHSQFQPESQSFASSAFCAVALSTTLLFACRIAFNTPLRLHTDRPIHLRSMNRYARPGFVGGASSSRASANTVCQKCLKKGTPILCLCLWRIHSSAFSSHLSRPLQLRMQSSSSRETLHLSPQSQPTTPQSKTETQARQHCADPV